MAQSNIPADYEERVYAGVLGKLIGVYLGRPFEGWSYDHIMRDLGEITYYVHERLAKPLVVTDDDISGTFTFLRALEDCGYSKSITSAQIGQAWLNYIIENKAVLWWGGMGNSTEHTAFQRLKRGIEAPRSGSMELNGKCVAEQIGAQIFIDGWGMVAPGDPELAADLAKKAGSVSHDGEAVFGAQVIAAMEAQAFVEKDMNKLLDTGVRFIPRDCAIRQLIDDIRGWHGADGDWRKTRQRIQDKYGYDKYGGGCHMVPNHAVIILALVYCEDNFQKSLLIGNTAGWDTDCNSGNVGCLMGIKNGLAGIEAGPDWRGPVADKLYLPTADGGRCVTDAVRESLEIAKAGRALAGVPYTPPKGGARFHFELPGSVQAFAFDPSAECKCIGTAWNAPGHSTLGKRSLAIGYSHLAPGRVARVGTPTFVTPEDAKMSGYGLLASPTLYSGQLLKAAFEADAANKSAVTVRPYIKYFGNGDKPVFLRGADVSLVAGKRHDVSWRVPNTGGQPIAEVGLEVLSNERADGSLYLDYLSWDGAPDILLQWPEGDSVFWHKAWVDATNHWWYPGRKQPDRVMADQGPGLLMHGTRDWNGYRVSAEITPHLASAAGIAACVQGLKRYYALLLCSGNKLRLVKEYHGRSVLSEADFPWSFDQTVTLALETRGKKLVAAANGKQVFSVEDRNAPLLSGGIALVIEEGRMDSGPVKVEPA